MIEFSFDINDYIVAQLTANELGITDKYNVQFVEYYVPSTKVSEIAEIKASGINYVELNDGSLHFNTINYEDFSNE